MKYIKFYEDFQAPSNDIKMKLDEIIKKSLEIHGGGKSFFNEIDNSIKSITNSDIILSLLRGNEDDWICVSGGFGDIVYGLYKNNKFKCKGIVVFNGKMLTKNKGVTSYYPYGVDLNGKEFVFIDDSLFSGSTYKKIDEFLSKYNSKIKSVSVIYDGSRVKSDIVNSFYRYYE